MKYSFRLLSLLSAYVAILFASAAARAENNDSPVYTPTEKYQSRDVEGWRVLVNEDFVDQQADQCGETLTVLRLQLHEIVRTVPAEPVEKLRKITIWVEQNEPHHPCAAYHPEVGWLREHDMNPDKARCVEIANAANFRRWTIDQPWMVLHELAHGYHDQFLGGFDNPQIRTAYENAMKSKQYEDVLRINGKHVRHYAATNPMEYFAEASEAFFGTNDFYPYVRSELKVHDAPAYGLLQELWRVKP